MQSNIINWPTFETVMALSGEKDLFGLFLEKKVFEPLRDKGFSISMLPVMDKDQLLCDDGFLYSPGWYNFFIKQDFISQLIDGNVEFSNELLNIFEPLCGQLDNLKTDDLGQSYHSTFICFHFLSADNRLIHCQVPKTPNIPLIKGCQLLFDYLAELVKKDEGNFQKILSPIWSADQINYYASIVEGKWQILDPLQLEADQFNKEYRKDADMRVHKPDLLVQEDRLSRKHTFGDNWVLDYDGLQTFINRPSDVALFSSICDKNLDLARNFHQNTIMFRHQYHTGSIPRDQEQREYFDYFELITTALIFAYSTIEAFTNYYIPEDYTHYHPKRKKDFDKEAIERKYSLYDKLVYVYTDCYQTPNPEDQSWWPKFEILQELRHQSIHTKQSKSEVRYSQLLERNIFETIGVYRQVVTFYGHFIKQKDRYLINEFPYGFGFDEIYPKLISDEIYRKIYNELHNPYHPL